jgi:glycosyltransferase involved in cell wall biosynthesis
MSRLPGPGQSPGPPPAPSRGGPEARLAAVAWARFQPRTAAIAEAFAGEAIFVSSRLRSHPALLPARYLAAAARTWRLLERRQPRRVVVITPPVFAPLVAWTWCRLRRRQLVIDCHTDTFHSRRWGWARPIHRWLLRRATAALVHTNEARELVAGWGAPALLLPDDLPGPADAEPCPSGPNRPKVLVAGSLDANEPVTEAVAMTSLLPHVEFRVTGDAGRLPASLTAGAPPNAVFTGYLPYRRFLGEMLAADAVAVFSTDPHIMNRAAFEAVGLGRPLILSDLQGLRARFGAAARFAANRPEAMAAAIQDALAQRAELAAASRELARDLAEQREHAMAELRGMLDEPPRHPLPRRVLLLTQHPFPDHPTVARAVSELLREALEVDLVCSASPAGSARPEPRPGLRVYRIPVRHRRRPMIRYPLEYAAFFIAASGVVSWLGLRRRYVAVQVDNLPDFLVFATPVPRWRGARLVFNMYELTPEMTAARFGGPLGRSLVRVTRWVERVATRWADHVIVVSRPCFDALRARGLAAERMSVVLNTTSGTAVAEPGDAGDGPPTLITHGTLVERYGVDVVIRAMAILRSSCPDLSLRVVGSGEQMEALLRLTRALGLADRVTFTGRLSWADTLEEVRRATLGVVAVLADGYGQLMLPGKLLEYARTGVPAVCSRLPAIEVYFPADTLAYFRPGDEQDLAAQVLRLLHDPELARRQAGRAVETARGMAWDHVRFDYLRALGLDGERALMA